MSSIIKTILWCLLGLILVVGIGWGIMMIM